MRVCGGKIVVLLAWFFPLTALADDSQGAVATLSVEGQRDQAEVVIDGTFQVPKYSIDALADGKQVVIHVEDAVLGPGGLTVHGSSALIVRSSASTDARGVRINIQLTRKATYRARSEDGKIRVSFDARDGATAPAAEPAQAAMPTAASPRAATVQFVGIERRNGRERVVIELDRPADFRIVPGESGPARMEVHGALLGARVPSRVQGENGSIVREVQIGSAPDRVTLSVQRVGAGNATAIREGNRIVWLFASEGPQQAGTNSRRTETIAREAAVDVDGEEVAAFLSDVPLQVGAAAKGGQRYEGRRIDLDFKDADIHNILRLLSEVGNVNVVTADDVGGSVTIKMRSVPWDQALDVILTSKGLGMVRRGNLIRVAPQATLEKERELAIAREKQRLALAPLETRLIPVSYAGAQTLQPRVNELLSERGKVAVDVRTNILVVRDVPENLDNVEELVRSLDTQTPQVLIEARIVEATTSFTNEFGIQWGGDVVMSSATGNPTGLVFPHDLTIAGGSTDSQTPTAGLSPFGGTPNPNFVVNFPAPAGTGRGAAIGLSMGSLSGNVNFSVRLSAFETTGQVRIISAPRILTLDNHAATISQGTSIPYSQVGAQGVQTTFQEAVLSLNVTPHVTNDGAVSMDVAISRNEPDFNQRSARGDPTILKRQAQTTLLVQDGHTAVIGGIYTRNSGHGFDQIPFFGDIPILGVLFQHHTQRDGRSELLIFLTPRIVNRGEALSH
ncbi:MAG TPA: type IV pilus secretin PilQ [Polyangiales bacterium]|nr:type IV pilus secretin PilQ [Polyangiales bacterium]